MQRENLKIIFILFICVFLTGCPKKILIPKLPETEKKSTPLSKLETEQEYPSEDEEELSIRSKSEQFHPIKELLNIYFDFSKTDINTDLRKILERNAEYLKSHKEFETIVEGHCCECGTNEYNMGLGQKRAKIVRDYYIKLGIEPKRIATISYGEEKPINLNAGPPDSPRCVDNRRAETKIRTKK